jgi:hypothetical protein
MTPRRCPIMVPRRILLYRKNNDNVCAVNREGVLLEQELLFFGTIPPYELFYLIFRFTAH